VWKLRLQHRLRLEIEGVWDFSGVAP
jgi:hypothetical protein